MFSKVRMVQLLPRVVRRVLGAVLAPIVALSLMMPAASACANGETAAAAISIVHKVEFDALTLAPASISKLVAAHDCCHKGNRDGDCSSAHCFVCSAVLLTSISNFAIDYAEISHVWPEHSALVVADPATNFRPPRLTA